MEKKIRIFLKLIVIIVCTLCFIRLIQKDETKFQLKQPEGEGISSEEVFLLLQELENSEPMQERAEGEALRSCLKELREVSEDGTKLFAYEDYITVLNSLLAETEEENSQKLRQELLFQDRYKEGFFLLKKDWYLAYDTMLAYFGAEKIIYKTELSILTGNENLPAKKLPENCLLDETGNIYRYDSEAFETCFFSTVTAYMTKERLLTVKEKKSTFTLSNLWIMEKEEGKAQFFYQDYEICCPMETAAEAEADREVLADVTFQGGSVQALRKKEERINGKLLRIGEGEIELEGKGIYPVAPDWKVYQLFGELREATSGELKIGYDFTDFVLEDGTVCGAFMMREEHMKSIRVAVKNNEFKSLYHEEIRMGADTDMELIYGDYGERLTETIPKGKEIVLTGESKYFKGNRIEMIPSIKSGRITVLSLNRNQGMPSYRGKMEIQKGEEGLLLINELPLEEYLYSVVPSEMPASYPMEALKAQAVCARTYAYRYLESPGLPKIGAHVDDSVSYQVYNNIAEHVQSTKAVKETADRLLTYEGEPVSTYYYSTSCGFGADAGVWKESNRETLPYLTSIHISGENAVLPDMTKEEKFREYILTVGEEDFEKEEPWYRWSYQVDKIDEKELSKRLQDRYRADSSKVLTLTGKKKDREKREAYESRKPGEITEIYDISCLKRREGGVMDELLLETDAGTYRILSEYNIRYLLNQGGAVIRQDGSKAENSMLLPSAYMIIDTVKKEKNVIGYTIFGGGYGHGVGMSQNGAKAMGKENMTFVEILDFFYPGLPGGKDRLGRWGRTMFRRLLFIGYDFGKHMSRKNISAFAASTAFFLFLSLIPMLMLVCALLPYIPLTEADLMKVAVAIAPDTMDSLLAGIIADVYDKSIGIISITAIVTLWSAGKGMLALMRGLNSINDVEENRNYFLLRTVASFYTILILVVMLISLIIMVFGNSLVKIIQNQIPQTAYLFDLLLHFRILFTWAVITVAIALMYTYVPGGKMGFKMQLPGAVVAAIGWSLITWGFSVYVDKFNGFTTYGSLTTIIVLMLWLYACMYIVMAGAFLNRYFKPAFQFFVGRRTENKMNSKTAQDS